MINAKHLDTNISSSLGIRGRLLIGFGIITLIFLVAMSITLVIITSTKNFTGRVIENELPTHDAFLNLGLQIYQSQASLFGMAISNDARFKNELTQSWTNIDQLSASLDEYAKSWRDETINKNWLEIKSLLIALKAAQTEALNHLNGTDKAAALAFISSSTIAPFDRIIDLLDGPINAIGVRSGGLFDTQYKIIHNDSERVINDLSTAQLSGYILSTVGLIASILIALWTARAILRHINVFRLHSSRIAAGDLRQALVVQGNDEIGQLGEDLNVMTESLAAITKQITQASHDMVTTIEEVKQAVNTQSSGATEQATSINEITASLEEIEKSSNQTMEKAKTLGEVAERTRQRGQQGLEAIEQSIQGMKAIREKVQIIAQTILDLSNQTQQVGEITSAVNGLAQQSKMLALNASIEAAKAGEAGKGFAVVAAEVKNLAEQSEQSTTQVQKILEDIRHAAEKAVMVTEEGTKGVDHGTGLVEETGEIVRNLSEVIHETTIASQQIEAAVRQEGVGIEQITAGMNEINQVTASFVASVKQTTEAISNLASIAKDLKERVDTYKI